MPLYAYSMSAVRVFRDYTEHRGVPTVIKETSKGEADKIAQLHAAKTFPQSEGWESLVVSGVEIPRTALESN